MEKFKGIYKLQEEMSELGVELAKLAVFPTGDHPGRKQNLKKSMLEEVADVQAAIAYFLEENGLRVNSGRVNKKLRKFRKWGLTGIDGTHRFTEDGSGLSALTIAKRVGAGRTNSKPRPARTHDR